MAGIKLEYERFMAWLATQKGTTDDVRRIAEIVYNYFDSIKNTTTAQSQRSKVLVPLLIADLAKSDEIPHVRHQGDADATYHWVRLRQLIVGPFRGFQQSETFDLDRRIVLFYGPNGTGKTSFCEALEYCLLGEVDEAAARRIPNATYLRNVRTGSFSQPTLIASNSSGAETSVLPDVDAFRFCFVEKNRIDSFSRIASKTEAQRIGLIATLFGLDGFNEFVRGFNNDIDKHLSLTDTKSKELELKRAALTIDNNVVLNEVTARAALESKEAALADAYEPDLSYKGLLAKLGNPDTPGRLQELEQVLLKQIPQEWNISRQSVLHAQKTVLDHIARLDSIAAKLKQRSIDVNFKSLFEALQGLATDVKDRCPACDTPLIGDKSVFQNPFDKARTGLAELASLVNMQEQQKTAEADVNRSSQMLFVLLGRLVEFSRSHSPQATVAINSLKDIPLKPADRWWESLHEQLPELSNSTQWQALLGVAANCEGFDEATRRGLAERQGHIIERDKLNALNVQVAELRAKKEQLIQGVIDARARISTFEGNNQDLVMLVEQERATIAHHQRVQAAYRDYLDLIKTYRAGLPAALTADLNESAMNLYNGFNRFENEAVKLTKLTLPANEDERIQVAYASDQNRLFDALQVMSEGHIRCLGLSILIAKNIKLNCPILIFDDPVNAIDNEHRLGIIHTIFENSEFAQKQILVACHGEEIIKDIENIIGEKTAKKDCFSYTFLHHDGNHAIRVSSSPTRNYIAEAEQLFSEGKTRNSIASARRAMESINNRTWRLLQKQKQGELRLKMSRNRAPLDQNDLATTLMNTMKNTAFLHPQKDCLLKYYEIMLAPPEWQMLNSGTHEEEGIPEFDREKVRRMIDNLTALDRALMMNLQKSDRK